MLIKQCFLHSFAEYSRMQNVIYIYFLCHLGFKSKQYGHHEQQAIISSQPSGGKM